MGREATCRCEWGSAVAEARALLETNELILRGGMKRKAGFGEMKDVSPLGDQLVFRVGDERVALTLGSVTATRWAEAILNPPTLAKKLGIQKGARVRIAGELDDSNLKAALVEAIVVSNGPIDLAMAPVRTRADLDRAVRLLEADLEYGAPVWIIYPKGKRNELTESEIRTTLRSSGLVDTKVASVSPEWTALRFTVRLAKRRR